jgi:hypothetical protein
MTRSMTLCIVLTSASIWAQTPATTQKATIAVTGCVAPVQRDGSLANKPTMTPPTPDAAAQEANNPEPTGRFMLTDATPLTAATSGQGAAQEKAAKPERTSYALRGREPEVAKHVGHRVEITGALMPPAAAKLPSKTAATAEGSRALQVEGIKMLGTDCSPKK